MEDANLINLHDFGFSIIQLSDLSFRFETVDPVLFRMCIGALYIKCKEFSECLNINEVKEN